ncbi:hypothetical protein KIW84_066417 [Lathyrus oleraceus]|uniref:Uncharacterized protein n=1 Tax=Pisum sativum TaxID=3888 RepID=A0A9D4WI66_PEA|nr:hypothetical protein KIW84_066417 [Pisum sativum]
MFNVVFHHGGKFVKLNDGDTIYMGVVSTIVNNDDAYDFAAYACATGVNRKMFVEHDVTDIEVTVKSPRCVNKMVELDRCDDERVEGFNDSGDERTTAIADGFDGIDVSLPFKGKC